MSVETTAVVITGMHRSGTSLVAATLGRCGVDLGSNLLGPDRGNHRGHFEDLDVVRFQDEVLRSLCGSSYPTRRVPPPPESFVAWARAFASPREGLWGFKDPRSVHFLAAWETVLPNPRFVFVVRHPFEVLSSFLRRGSDPEMLTCPSRVFESWRLVARAILDHRQLGTAVSTLVEPFALVRGARGVVERLGRDLEIPLDPARAEGVVHEEELHGLDVDLADRWLERASPETWGLWTEIRSQIPSSWKRDGSGHVSTSAEEALARAVDVDPRLVLGAALAELAPATLMHREQGLRDLGDRLENLTENVMALEQSRDLTRAENEQLRRFLEEARRELEETRRSEARAREQADRIQARGIGEGAMESEVSEQSERLAAEATRLRGVVRGLSAHTNNLERELHRYREEKAGLEAHGRNLQIELERQRELVSGLTAHTTNLETELERLREARSAEEGDAPASSPAS